MSLAMTSQYWRVYRFSQRRYPTLDNRIDAAIQAFSHTFASPPRVVLVPPGQTSGRKDVIVRVAGAGEPGPIGHNELALGPIVRGGAT